MEITNKQRQIAIDVFKGNPKLTELFINNKGEFFTTKDLAINSVKDASQVKVIAKDSVHFPPVVTFLEVTTLDGQVLKFEDVKTGETPAIKAKAKVEGKSANGIYKIEPSLQWKFTKGALVEIIEPQPNN